jgi:hypothetical protein
MTFLSAWVGTPSSNASGVLLDQRVCCSIKSDRIGSVSANCSLQDLPIKRVIQPGAASPAVGTPRGEVRRQREISPGHKLFTCRLPLPFLLF